MSAQTASKKKNVNLEKQVQKSLSHIINDFILANLKLIGIVIVVIIAIAAGLLGWNSYAKGLNEKALTLEAEAFSLFEKINETSAETESDQSWEDVLALYQQILDDYPNTASAERALVLSGNLQYTHEQYADAQKQFSAYLAKYPNGQLRNQAEESLGYVYEQQGDYQQALVTFKKAEANAPDSRKSVLLLAIGRNYENLSQTDQAIETYQRVLESNTSSGWKDMAQERVEILQPAPAVAPAIVSEESVEDGPTTEGPTE